MGPGAGEIAGLRAVQARRGFPALALLVALLNGCRGESVGDPPDWIQSRRLALFEHLEAFEVLLACELDLRRLRS